MYVLRPILACLLILGTSGLWLAPAFADGKANDQPAATSGEPTNAQEAAAKKAAEDAAIAAKYNALVATLPADEQAWERTLQQNLGKFYLPIHKRLRVQGRSSCWDFVQDDPKLPRVLLVGDSISGGYTLPTRKALAGKANVHKAPENCGPTANGLKKLDVWLGDGRWDVIHFNFGIHDRKTPVDVYSQRLEQIIARLEKTGAKLIWASTTPVPAGTQDGPAMPAAIVERNRVAAAIMLRHAIAVDDLYAALLPHVDRVMKSDNVHPNGEGYALLGQQVAAAIEAALEAIVAPRMTLDTESLSLLAEAARALDAGFADLPACPAPADFAAMRRVLLAAAERLRDNYPYHHPLYIGQMLKPPHAIARLAYALALFLNPNNHAADGGRASSIMERQALAKLARLIGWERHLGHLTSGGTMANFEALWIARQLRPASALAASTQAHYTHARLAAVLGMPFCPVPVDASGRMSVAALAELAAAGQIGTVVATLGTTAAGAVDPLPEILAVAAEHGLRVHVDAAYGGYFKLAGNLDRQARAAFDRMDQADSLVIDPHKHGLQPYGCGCVLFEDPSVARFYQHDSPYTYFVDPPAAGAEEPEFHLGEISLECSRSGASAVALWATLELLPLEPGGEFARGLEAGRDAALALHAHLARHARFAPLVRPELDIVAWAVRAPSASESSLRARRLFEAAARRQLHLALATFPRAMLEPAQPVEHWDADAITCLRACVMKPEHRQWLPRIVEILDAAADEMA